MKTIALLFAVFFTSFAGAQTHINIKDIKPDKDFDNIHIKKISDDEEQTTFVIWVKKSVKAHYHAVHSENIYVVEGKGKMTVDGKEIEIGPGDYLNFYKKVPHAVLEVTSKKPLKVISVQCPQFKGEDRVFIEEKK